MGLPRTVFEINSDFYQKSQIFPTPVYLTTTMKEHPLGSGAQSKKNYNDGATGLVKRFDDIFSRLDTIHERFRQTDGRTDAGLQQRPRLRIATRLKIIKNHLIFH